MSTRRRFTEDERRAILKEVDDHGLSITIRKHGISASHIYSWRKRTESDAAFNTALEAELRRLRQENQQLKEMVAEKELFIRIKDSLLKKTLSRGKTD
jgi:transposase-like protein